MPRIVVVAAGTAGKELDRLLLGGYIFGQASSRKGDTATVVAEVANAGDAGGDALAVDLAMGATLRSYTFKKYQTKKSEEGEESPRTGLTKLIIACAKPDAAAKAFVARKAVADGVFLARDLVNEPANALGPVEFADRLAALTDAGLDVEVLDEAQLEELKMGSVGRRARQRASSPCGRHAVARRQVEADEAVVLRRQGRGVRHGRYLDEARRGHGGT